MPNDVTAQAFREAAAIAKRDGDAAFTGLLLAAAEQREQLEKFVDMHARQMRVKDGVIEANGIIREGLEKQIATLTAENEALTDERDNLRQAYDTVQDNEFAALSPSTHAQNLAQQVRTLTAERDQARHTVQLLCDLISQHPDPAPAELLPDILDPRERTD